MSADDQLPAIASLSISDTSSSSSSSSQNSTENKNSETTKATDSNNNASTTPTQDLPSVQTPTATPASPQQPKKLGFDDFVMGENIGDGAYSEVVKCTEKSNGKIWAAKVMSKAHIVKMKKVDSVHSEKAIINKLHHPNVVRLYATFQTKTHLFYILELCTHGELLDVIRKQGKFPLEVATFYAAELTSAIEHLAGLGIIHRDIKPENTLLSEDNHLKLSDFGCAVDLGGPSAPEDASSSTFVGTAEYIPPELLTEKKVGRKGDIWALGCVIFQMLCGYPPFKGVSHHQTYELIKNNTPTYPADFPPAAQDLINQLLNKTPEQRPSIEAIKSHPFFESINWENLASTPSPLKL
eukprot:TRINITY_DN1903_c0_g1_i1.p1 TRINITY_DN1903_c0_g1~~TRINITY_DN1903_c0_g1_i1.p1  ORF type:complete len:401 (-),score=104.34 TRINITY_DN1903_c0_g1_i1:163-1221(-)